MASKKDTQILSVSTAAVVASFAMSAEGMDKLIASIKTRSTAVVNDIHRVGMALLYSTAKHSDMSKASTITGFMSAMSEGVRRREVQLWLETYSNLRLTYDAKTKAFKVRMLKEGDTDYRVISDADLLKANDNPFWQRPEAAPVPLVVDELWLSKALARIVKAVDKAKEEGNLKLAMPADLAIVDHLRKDAEAVKLRSDRAIHQAGLAALALKAG
jgi:hypothetical protein